MKKFTKLALAASVAFSANAMAMQAMDDASLSATTGQDGISIGIGISKIEIEKLYIHDTDGYTSPASATGPVAPSAGNPLGVPASMGWGGTTTAGSIVIYGNGEDGHVNENHGIVIGANYDVVGGEQIYLLPSRNLADLTIDSDAGGGNPFINIAAEVSGLDINIGKIGVVATGDEPAATATSIRRGGQGVTNDILSGLSLKTGPMTANIQLGAAPQGAMIKLNATMVGGLTIEDLGILDNSTVGGTVAAGVTTSGPGEIFIESIKLTDANSKDLKLNQSISVFGESTANDGFIRIVSTSGAHDNYVKGIHLGSRDAASIGDMEIQGMQTYYSPAQGTYVPGAIITIAGH
ncbi:putative pilus system protein FilA [Acinetobacter variabilis]|uniref:putative pilus system protein FilA n=1 Tax=Acinetobacter variabilis TaxID=70346 RepID=UPI003D78386C